MFKEIYENTRRLTEDRRTVYSKEEFDVLLDKGMAEIQDGRHLVKDADENWMEVKVYEASENQTPKSKAQKIFVEELNRFIAEQERLNKELDLGTDDVQKELSLYYFHDDKSVSVDGILYDILTYGGADYGYGSEFNGQLTKALEDAGYYLEAQGGGVFNFAQ